MTLSELHKKYGTQDKCIAYLEKTRWGKQHYCILCGSIKVKKRKKYLPFYLAEFSYKYNNRHLQNNSFHAIIENTVKDEKCMINYKPVRDTKEIAYGKRTQKKCLS